jgi:hypothetical protein
VSTNREKTLEEGTGIGIAKWDGRTSNVTYSYRLTQEVLLVAGAGGGHGQVEGLKSGHGTIRAKPDDAFAMALANDLELQTNDGRLFPILARRQTGDLIQWVLRGAPVIARAG